MNTLVNLFPVLEHKAKVYGLSLKEIPPEPIGQLIKYLDDEVINRKEFNSRLDTYFTIVNVLTKKKKDTII